MLSFGRQHPRNESCYAGFWRRVSLGVMNSCRCSSFAPEHTVEMSDSITNRHCLLVLFRTKLTLATGVDSPFKRFRVEQTTYEDVGLGRLDRCL